MDVARQNFGASENSVRTLCKSGERIGHRSDDITSFRPLFRDHGDVPVQATDRGGALATVCHDPSPWVGCDVRALHCNAFAPVLFVLFFPAPPVGHMLVLQLHWVAGDSMPP